MRSYQLQLLRKLWLLQRVVCFHKVVDDEYGSYNEANTFKNLS